ncbi:DUF2299 family protein [Halobacteriaceae archaeon GCM10025711]
MPTDIDEVQVRDWIDDELVEGVEAVPDDAAVFNLTVQMSGMLVHVIKRQPSGPLVVGQEIAFDDDIQNRIQGLASAPRGDLVTRVRETLMDVPGVYGFVDEQGTNVAFEDVSRVFLEYRVYPDEADQQTLMEGLVGVWKGLRYLDDIWTLIDSVENQR